MLNLLSCASAPPYPVSDHFDGQKFFNPGGPQVKGFREFLKWQWTRKASKWPDWIPLVAKPNPLKNLSKDQISTTYINHSTHLIQIQGLHILTDPQFSKRASPIQWLGPKRIRPPGLEIKDLGKVDLVLISHGHYDHLDEGSVRELAQKFNPVFVTPLGNGKYLKSYGAEKVIELDWWQTAQLPFQNIQVDLVPAQHWTQRGLFGRNKALWGGFVILSPEYKIYFSGDTGYKQELFTSIREKYGPPDLSLIAIGAYEPRWFMGEQHLNPDDAVLAHRDLQSKFTLGNHFGSFPLTDEAYDDPPKHLEEAKVKHGLRSDEFIAPENGQTHHLKIQ